MSTKKIRKEEVKKKDVRRSHNNYIDFISLPGNTWILPVTHSRLVLYLSLEKIPWSEYNTSVFFIIPNNQTSAV